MAWNTILFMHHPMFKIDEIKVATEALKGGYDVQNLKWHVNFSLTHYQ